MEAFAVTRSGACHIGDDVGFECGVVMLHTFENCKNEIDGGEERLQLIGSIKSANEMPMK